MTASAQRVFTEPSPDRHRGATHAPTRPGHTVLHDREPCQLWVSGGEPVPRVLIGEAASLIANAMATHLRHAGMDVEWADRGDRAMKKLRFERHDVAIIDLMLPGMDGWRMIETLRADGFGIPLIVVSARGTEQDKVHALGIGGDDYLAKPFGMGELVARVKAAIRRGGAVSGGVGGGGRFRGGGGTRGVGVPGLVVNPDPPPRPHRRPRCRADPNRVP